MSVNNHSNIWGLVVRPPLQIFSHYSHISLIERPSLGRSTVHRKGFHPMALGRILEIPSFPSQASSDLTAYELAMIRHLHNVTIQHTGQISEFGVPSVEN